MTEILSFVALMATSGYILRRTGLLSKEAPSDLSKLVFYFTLPALIFTALHDAQLQWTVAILPVAAWLVVGFGVLLGFILVKLLKLKGPDAGALMLTIAFGNTTFLGYPIIQGFYGNQALALAAFYDLFGAMLAANTVGVLIGVSTGRVTGLPSPSGQTTSVTTAAPTEGAELVNGEQPDKSSWRDAAKAANINKRKQLWMALWRLLRFPPIWALIIAIALHSVVVPEGFSSILERIGLLTVPLIMLSIGLTLQFSNWKERLPVVAMIILCRLIVIPLVTWIVLEQTSLSLQYKQVIVLQAGMPSMFNSYLMGNLFGLNTNMIINTIFYSTVLSFITLPMWFSILGS